MHALNDCDLRDNQRLIMKRSTARLNKIALLSNNIFLFTVLHISLSLSRYV